MANQESTCRTDPIAIDLTDDDIVEITNTKSTPEINNQDDDAISLNANQLTKETNSNDDQSHRSANFIRTNQISNNVDKSNELIVTVTSQYCCKQFYESAYDKITDDRCFEKIDQQATELCRQINEDRFKFVVKQMKAKKIRSFIAELKATDLFLIHFELKTIPGKTKRSKPTIDYRVRPGYLSNVIKICFVLGDNTIYSFKPETFDALKEGFDTHGFEFEKDSVVAVCFDVKLVFKILKCCLEIDDKSLNKLIWHDPKIAHWLIDPDANEPICLLDICKSYLQIDKLEEFVNQIFEDSLKNLDYKILSQTLLLYPIMSNLRKQLIDKKLFDSYINVELPVLCLFGVMELSGFTIDKLLLKKSIKDWSKILDDLKTQVRSLNQGQDVNPRSSQQVNSFLKRNNLYEKYVELVGLPEGVTIDQLKTGRDVLEKMATFSDLPTLILDQRVLHHLIDFAAGLDTALGNENKIMGLYKHFISTGRVAMHDPNLLAIDKDHKIKSDGREIELSLKKVFVAKPGYLLISADYSQLELRILASLSQESNLTDIFDMDKDPFKLIAAKIKNKNVEQISEFERNSTKQIIYAIIYGMGLKRLQSNLGVESEEMARQFLDEFYEVLPKLKTFIETTKANARVNGYIETLFSRRRLLPEINSEDDNVRGGDERKSVNSTIQGSAADLVKLTMLKINKAIHEQGFDAEFLLQLHDELIFSIRNEEASIRKFIEILKCEMTSCGSVLKTKFQIKVKQGSNWSEMTEVSLSNDDAIA